MAKAWKKIASIALVAAIAIPSAFSLAACKDKGPGNNTSGLKQGTYRTHTVVLPSNWNELTYEDNNDRQILDYLVSSFYEYDYKFDEAKGGKFKADGTVNSDAIVHGGFDVKYSAATKLEDVTDSVDAKWGYTDAQKQAGGYAYKITLRQDLKWDDGTPIDATDFVYTMQQQLDPLFQNMRASSFYNNITIKNARNYVYQNSTGWFPASGPYSEYTEELDDKLIFTIGNSEENAAYGKAVCDMRTLFGFPDSYDAKTAAEYLVGNGVEGVTADQILALNGKTFKQIKADEGMTSTWNALYKWWGEVPNEQLHFFVTEYTYPELSFDNVGLYSPSKYELVVCLDNPIQCLKEDGSLSYEAAYSFQSLPLVKKDLYEKCKKEPVAGSTLWTSNYNSSVETSASWGPYKLTQFQGGKSYTLEKNPNWFGYALEDNKNQYNITKITCEVLADTNTQWMSFLSGQVDEIALDVTHKDDYRNSKYTLYSPNTGTFGLNLYADLNVLKEGKRNNGILAIKDFRKAISLYLDRDDYNATCYTSHRSCYGIMGPAYYYDVENGGVYRDTEYAMKALLRVYGFTENDNGSWTDGKNTYPGYEDAYEAMNGMNRDLAKQLVDKAYDELTANAEKYGYDANKQIELKFGTSESNESTQRQYNYFKSMLEDMVKGTKLEGKLNVTFDASFGSKWAEEFKSGSYDLAAGTGFTGGPFDPAGFLQCYLDPEAGLMYSTWWDTKNEQMTFTMPEGDYDGAGEKLTMSIYNWYCCLNGIAESRGQVNTYNWGAGAIPETARLQLLAALEEVTLNQYYTIVTTSQYDAVVTGAKNSYITTEYNMFMGFGGYRYMVVNYTDSEWTSYVQSNNGDLSAEYKKQA